MKNELGRMQVFTDEGAACVTPTIPTASALAALGTTTKVVAMAGCPLPSTFTLKSVDATRKIEFSTDGGFEYFQPAYDVTSATMLITSTNAGISHVRFTALSTDTWSIG